MYPGVVYDRQWQCNDYYGPMKPCELGPDKNCKHLSFAPIDSKRCMTKSQSAHGNNKWCFEGKWVDTGKAQAPLMLNRESGVRALSVYCLVVGANLTLNASLTIPDQPTVYGAALWSWRYRLCNREFCVHEDAWSFREVQCQEHNEGDIIGVPPQWWQAWTCTCIGLLEQTCTQNFGTQREGLNFMQGRFLKISAWL
jgi:hypothetical protein